MERNRDLRRATISTVNGLPRRPQRITTLKDSTDEDRQMELQETVRIRDRERLQKKDRDREFPKRRRVDRPAVQQRSGGGESFRENYSTDSSHEEYYEEEEDEEEANIRQQNRLNQLSPTSSYLSNNRRGLRKLRSSPVLRAAADEMLGVPIPRRARSSSAKRLHEYWNSGSGGFGEDLNHRRFSPYPATVSLIGSGGASPPPSGAMKKKMKSVERKSRGLSGVSNSRPASVIQDDIEIEVAEALFDLMKQSQPEFQSSQKHERVERDTARTADDELKRLKAENDQDESNTFTVHNEQSIKMNAETIVVDSVKELKNEGRIEREKFPDDTAKELVSGDGFVNKGKVGSPKEKESPSCVKVNAGDIQDPTVTKTDYAEILVEAKKETRLEIDLMAPPLLASSPERDVLVEMPTDPKVMVQDVQKKSETTPKNGPLPVSIHMQEEKVGVVSSNQLPNLELEKCRHDTLIVSGSTTHQLQARKEQKNQSPASLVPFPIGMSSWAGVLPHPGYMPALQAVLPIDGARSSMTMQHPQFKLSQPRPKRCATHQHIAQNINSHQQLIKKSLSSGPTGSTPFYGTKSLNPKSMLPTQKFITGNPFLGEFQERQNLATISSGSGKDKSSDATTNEKSVIQQASHQTPANNFLHGPGFIFPLGHHQTTMMAPANSSGPPESASAVSNSSAGRTSTNLPLPGGSALSFNHPMFTSNEAAATYMAMLQNNGCPVPISTNIAMPLKGGTPTIPFFNSPFYSSQMFNVQSASQNMSTFSGSSSHKHPPNQQQTSTKINDNKAPTQPEKQFQPFHSSSNKHGDPPQQGSKGRIDFIPQTFALSFGSNASTAQALNFSSMAQNSTIFQMLPDIARNRNQMPHQKNFQTSEGKFPTSGGSQSFNFSKSDFAAKFDGFNFLPSSLTGIQPFQSSSAGASVTIPNFQQHQNQPQQLNQLQKNQMQQLTANSSFLPQWENFHRTTGAAPEGPSQSVASTLVNIPQLKNSQGQTNITFGNSPASFQGQQIAIKSKGVCSSVSALPAQETENGSNQKSSPACRRNVPSILSTCPTQLSELKY